MKESMAIERVCCRLFKMIHDDLPNGPLNFSSCFSDKITDTVPWGLNILQLKKKKKMYLRVRTVSSPSSTWRCACLRRGSSIRFYKFHCVSALPFLLYPSLLLILKLTIYSTRYHSPIFSPFLWLSFILTRFNETRILCYFWLLFYLYLSIIFYPFSCIL